MELKLQNGVPVSGENDARLLNVAVEEAYASDEIRLAFLTPAGRRLLSAPLTLTNGEGQFPLPAAVLDADGRLYAQIVAENDDLRVAKSEMFAFDVEKSVRCGETEPVGSGLITLGGVQTQLSLLQSAFDAHTHDARYYTEGEADALLAGKADAVHTHDGRYYTEAEADALLAGKADAAHTHDGRYYTEAEVDALISSVTGDTVASGTFTPQDENADILYSRVWQRGDTVYVNVGMALSAAPERENVILGQLGGVSLLSGTDGLRYCAGISGPADLSAYHSVTVLFGPGGYVTVCDLPAGDRFAAFNIAYKV